MKVLWGLGKALMLVFWGVVLINLSALDLPVR